MNRINIVKNYQFNNFQALKSFDNLDFGKLFRILEIGLLE